jgi:uncharacterized protein YbbC (DUF1343 family)
VAVGDGVDAKTGVPVYSLYAAQGNSPTPEMLKNVDALKDLSALQDVTLNYCTGLTNVDALANLPALRFIRLSGCAGLSPENVAALKEALPRAKISRP